MDLKMNQIDKQEEKRLKKQTKDLSDSTKSFNTQSISQEKRKNREGKYLK